MAIKIYNKNKFSGLFGMRASNFERELEYTPRTTFGLAGKFFNRKWTTTINKENTFCYESKYYCC